MPAPARIPKAQPKAMAVIFFVLMVKSSPLALLTVSQASTCVRTNKEAQNSQDTGCAVRVTAANTRRTSWPLGNSQAARIVRPGRSLKGE
jgi:hypothetical protein